MHVANASVFVGCVIINAGLAVAARGIAGIFVLPVVCQHATARHGDRGENVKELLDTLLLAAVADGFLLDEYGANKAGGAGKVAGKAQSSHA